MLQQTWRWVFVKCLPMIRFFDILFSFIGLLVCSPMMVCLFVICYIETRSPIFKQERIGKYKRVFNLYKFRTMRMTAKTVPTHLLAEADITRMGWFLENRKWMSYPNYGMFSKVT